ncbi:hypothetical protein BST61_g4210 [Cercospora zeina]
MRQRRNHCDVQQHFSNRDQRRASSDDSSGDDTSDQRPMHRDAPFPTIEQRRSHADARQLYAQESFGYDEPQRWYTAHGFTQAMQPAHSAEDHRSRVTSPASSAPSAGPPSAASALSDRGSSPREDAPWPPMGHQLGAALAEDSHFTQSTLVPGPYYTSMPITYVAMPDVQAIADESHDMALYPQSDHTAYPFDQRYQVSHAQAGDERSSNVWHSTDTRAYPEAQARAEQDGSVAFHHRRTQSAGADKTTSGRVGRRPRLARSRTGYQQVTGSGPSSSQLDRQPNTFPCIFAVYGCERRFSSKNEWKRHIQTKHVITEDWWCQLCQPGASFNRKDLFMQHILRMHSSKRESDAISRGGAKAKSEAQRRHEDTEAQRCYRTLRQPPGSSRCVVCKQAFRGPGGWEQCLDHIGRHLDAAARGGNGNVLNPATWQRDHDLEDYLRNEGLFPPEWRKLIRAACLF